MGQKKYKDEDVADYLEYYPSKTQGGSIRRYVKLVDGSKVHERLPPNKYKNHIAHLTDQEAILLELERICRIENDKQFIKSRNYKRKLALKNLIIKSPWVTIELRTKFNTLVITQRKNSKDINYLHKLFENKILNFFINIQKIPDPKMWSSVEHLWGLALMNSPKEDDQRIWEEKNYEPSAKTIITIVQLANNFIDFLKREDPTEYSSLMHLKPITKNKLLDHEYNRKKKEIGLYVTDDHWREISDLLQSENFIQNNLNGLDIFPFVKLCYEYGLRRNESLGVSITTDSNGKKVNDVRGTALAVCRQVEGLERHADIERVQNLNGKFENKNVVTYLPIHGILKGKHQRMTPHWFSSNEETYATIQKIGKGKCKIIHPDTFTLKWKVAIDYLLKNKKIDKDYDLHDLRRTFITRALEIGKSIHLVSQAAGHKSITTTMLYVKEKRDGDLDEYTPPI